MMCYTGDVNMVRKNGLIAPKEFWKLSYQELRSISNGCGPTGLGWLVPDRYKAIGLDLTWACHVHDMMYEFGYPKQEADALLLENALCLASRAYWPFQPVAEQLAYMYFTAVKNGGGRYYEQSGTA